MIVNILKRLSATQAPRSVVLIRVMVGAVFLSEGIQKFLFPEADGVGRFLRMGIPSPEIMAPFVGVLEIVCGLMILTGFLTRLATLPLLVVIGVAITATKIPVMLGHEFWRFSLPKLNQYGFWSMAHEGRADFSMLVGLLFLLIAGAGPWAFDARLSHPMNKPKQ
jgi:uncharacterized membrane protein YphA (DoxX/SURF4 family)